MLAGERRQGPGRYHEDASRLAFSANLRRKRFHIVPKKYWKGRKAEERALRYGKSNWKGWRRSEAG